MESLKAFLNFPDLDATYAFGLCGVFVGIYLAVYGLHCYLIDPVLRRRALKQRLAMDRREKEITSQIFKTYQETRESLLLTMVSKVAGWGKVENLQRRLLQADIYLTPAAFLSLIGILGSMGFILIVILQDSLLWGLVAGLVLGLAPMFVMRWKRIRKAKKFEMQMPEAMELLARSLRAGHTLSATLELVSQETAAPLGQEMRITYEEQRLGLSMPQAMRRMGDRVDSRDLRYFVTAVLIQTETGGNLAEILENIGFIIRERIKLKSKVKGLTAEGRFSAVILSLLPLVVFMAIFLLNREYIMVLLREPLGARMLMGAAISILLGVAIMKKMVQIKV
jgi:tight adherence protein B